MAKQSAARSLTPALRALSEAPLPVPDSTSMTYVERRLISATTEIALHGQWSLAQLYENTNTVFREATGEVLRATREIRDEEHYELCSGFAGEMHQEVGCGLTQVYRVSEAQTLAVTAAPLPRPEPEPPPRRSFVEVRQLTLAERISGKAIIVHEEG
jgi:hypothetical protein